MQKSQKAIKYITFFLILIFFLLYIIPNSKASENLAMVSMFEPDEAAVLPVTFDMISPKESLKSFVYKFVFYDYYYYGFPFFAPSALILFPLQWLDQLRNTPLVMLTLRQIISVLPMLAGILILVYMQDQFRTYRSVVLTLFLLTVPAIVRNGFWWHPDGLVLFLSVLVLYFLWKDDKQFSWRFYLAAVLCGLLTATKLIGVYFFLAIGMLLIWGLIEKKLTWKKLFIVSFLFIATMAVIFILSNPFVLSSWTRNFYFNIIKKQSGMLSSGYNIIYKKGLSGAWPLMHEFYGEAIFLVTVIGVSVWGAIKGKDRFLHALTLAWFIPLTISLLVFSHFKFQYWIPVAIPLISNLVILLPEKWKGHQWSRYQWVVRIIFLVIIAIQFFLYSSQSVKMVTEQTRREEENPSIVFYDQAINQLAPVMPNTMNVYYDYRLYVPETEGWSASTSFDLLDYGYINDGKYQILLLLEQRIRNYLNPNATGIDQEQFAISQEFYRDADNGTIEGYQLLYRDQTALIFVQDEVCHEYFEPDQCK